MRKAQINHIIDGIKRCLRWQYPGTAWSSRAGVTNLMIGVEKLRQGTGYK